MARTRFRAFACGCVDRLLSVSPISFMHKLNLQHYSMMQERMEIKNFCFLILSPAEYAVMLRLL